MSIGDHRAQLEDVNFLAALADALLTKKWLAWGVGNDCHTGSGNRDGKNDAHTSGEHDVESTLRCKITSSALLGSSSRGIRRRCFVGAGCYIVRSRHRILNRRRKLHFGMLRTGNSRHSGTSTRLLHIFGCLAVFLVHFSLSKSLPWVLLTICRPAWARTVRPPIGISRYARRLRWFTLRTQSSLPFSGPSTITNLPSSM